MNGMLLLVTADREFVRKLEDHLRSCEIDCHVASASADAIERVTSPRLDAVLFDLDSAADPFLLLRSFRTTVGARVLLACSRKEAGVDVILAYESGADDYFAKSTELVIVEAKIRRAIKRRQVHALGLPIAGSANQGSMAKQTLFGVVEPELTRLEHRLLRLFVIESGQLVLRATILEQLWGRASADPKLLYEHISTLRTKLQARGWTITNVRGKGYRLEPNPSVFTRPTDHEGGRTAAIGFARSGLAAHDFPELPSSERTPLSQVELPMAQ